jgi:hypothetical protein
MAYALVKAFNLKGSYYEEFKDVPSTHPYFSYIDTLAANRITTGVGDGRFLPNNSVTRTSYSVFIARALKGNFKGIVGTLQWDMTKSEVSNALGGKDRFNIQVEDPGYIEAYVNYNENINKFLNHNDISFNTAIYFDNQKMESLVIIWDKNLSYDEVEVKKYIKEILQKLQGHVVENINTDTQVSTNNNYVEYKTSFETPETEGYLIVTEGPFYTFECKLTLNKKK